MATFSFRAITNQAAGISQEESLFINHSFFSIATLLGKSRPCSCILPFYPNLDFHKEAKSRFLKKFTMEMPKVDFSQIVVRQGTEQSARNLCLHVSLLSPFLRSLCAQMFSGLPQPRRESMAVAIRRQPSQNLAILYYILQQYSQDIDG